MLPPIFQVILPVVQIEGVADVVAVLLVKVVGAQPGTDVGRRVLGIIGADLHQRHSARRQARYSQFAREISAAHDGKLRREIFAEISLRVIEPGFVRHARRNDVVHGKEILHRVAVNTGVAVYVAASRGPNADRRCFRPAERRLHVFGDIVVEPNRPATLVLLSFSKSEKVAYKSIVEEITAGRIHVLHQTHTQWDP